MISTSFGRSSPSSASYSARSAAKPGGLMMFGRSPCIAASARIGLAEVEAERRLGQRAAVAPQRVIDDRVFEHALDVILRLEDRDRLDPVEDGDGPRARVAVGAQPFVHIARPGVRSEEHTSELQSLMRISY